MTTDELSEFRKYAEMIKHEILRRDSKKSEFTSTDGSSGCDEHSTDMTASSGSEEEYTKMYS